MYICICIRCLKIVRQQGKDANVGVKQSESDITFHIGKQEAELALKVNCAAYHGDLHQLKDLIQAGADPNKTDFDGRSPLVCCKSYNGFASVVLQISIFSHCSLNGMLVL